MSWIRRVLLPSILLTLPACAPQAPRGPQVGPISAGGQSAVHVENDVPVSLRVFVLRAGGAELYLGRVAPLRSSTFTLPAGMTGSLQLAVRPNNSRSGAERHLSEPFVLTPGHRVTWQLRASPGTSNLPSVSTLSIFGCGDAC